MGTDWRDGRVVQRRTTSAGTIDEVALYPLSLNQSQISQHWALSGWGVVLPNQAPTASFVSTANRLAVSQRIGGPVIQMGQSLRTPGTSETEPRVRSEASHTYAAEGTFTTKLTVTDNSGDGAVLGAGHGDGPEHAARACFHPVQPPTRCELRRVRVRTNDPDGSLTSYEWETLATVSLVRVRRPAIHTVRQGNFLVTLKVTDNRVQQSQSQGRDGDGANACNRRRHTLPVQSSMHGVQQIKWPVEP